jgi:YidC/Oxa1 family membrane protein insertase
MGLIFNNFVYLPLYNLLIFVYNVVPFHDFGLAIIIVTLLIKFALVPLSRKQIESQKKMQELQPKIKELQNKHKQDKEKQSKALMELYKEHKTNPFSGCLPMIVQLIFLIAIYRVFFNISNAGLTVDAAGLYPFVHNPGQISHMFFGIIDLTSVINLGQITFASLPHVILVVAAAAAQYFQTKMLMATKQPQNSSGKETDFAQTMSKQMLYLGPLLTLFIGIKFPAGLALYWLVSTGFMIAQQYYIQKCESLAEAKKA